MKIESNDPNAKKEIIVNPNRNNNFPFQIEQRNEDNRILAGSNYSNMVPQVGVRIKEDNNSKNGGLNFQAMFGKMSLNEYEKLRNHYMGLSNNQYSHQRVKREENDNNNEWNVVNNSNTAVYSNKITNVNMKGYNKANNEDRIVSHINWKHFEDDYAMGEEETNNGYGQGIIMNENLFKKRRYTEIKGNVNKKEQSNTFSPLDAIVNNQYNTYIEKNEINRTMGVKRKGTEINMRTRRRMNN